jgi:hypothetical protein
MASRRDVNFRWASSTSWFEHPSLQIGIPQIIIHKAHEPDVVVHFFDSDGLSCKDLAEVDFEPVPVFNDIVIS